MQTKAAFISEKGGDRTVRGKDLLEKMSLADDKYIEEASGYKKNRHIKILKTALIAAAVLAVLLPVIFIVAAKTNGTFSSPGHINSSAGDWPYYNTKRELENAATSIYDGVITDIFFKVIDMKTGEVVTSEPEEYSSSYRLHTVYEVKVTHNYKNADSEKKYFCIKYAASQQNK